MASRDGRVIEADVGLQAAADPGPALGEGDRLERAVEVEREVRPGGLERAARLREPVRPLDRVHPARLLHRELAEDRRALEVLPATVRALRYLVAFVERDRKAAALAAKAPRAGKRTGRE